MVGYRSRALARIYKVQVTVYHDPDATESSLNALFEDRDGDVWVGFYGKGIARFEDGPFRHLTMTGRIQEIAQTPDGALWFAADGGGVLRWLREARAKYSTSNGLPSDRAMCVHAGKDGDVWVGTASGGLIRTATARSVAANESLRESECSKERFDTAFSGI